MSTMLHSSRATPALPLTSPGPDISRHQLKQLARWIRDDLDVLVAREGPDVLRPDDVVRLHEMFLTLRHATNITALDLRATGIHKAVKDIAGTATRWPSRLLDDCDKVISVWTSKFGPLNELHPFLFGRNGRLEGIAIQAEYSREALLHRWSHLCPDKIDPKVSHRRGSLGFRAGDWWISPLFAHHAGIIGLESVEGGTTFDAHGAYALVLKGVSEVEARDEDCLTYRSKLNDKGRFRLTDASAKSREPVRLLRCHCTTSNWGPRAGIRYEGLYSVKGWCLRQAKLNDALTGEWKEGDILYEVRLQRNDPVPMKEVTRRPNNTEVDDYVEYKRLRKLRSGDTSTGSVLSTMPEITTILPPLTVPISPRVAPQSLSRMSSSIPRTAMFKEPAFDAPKAVQGTNSPPTTDFVSPMTIPDQHGSFFTLRNAGDHMEFAKGESAVTASSSNSVSVTSTLPDPFPRDIRTSLTRSTKGDLKDIVPWIDLEDISTTDHLPSAAAASAADQEYVGTASKELGVTAAELNAIRKKDGGWAVKRLEAKAAELNPVKTVRMPARHTRWSSRLNSRIQEAAEDEITKSTVDLRLNPPRFMRGRSKDGGRERAVPKVFGEKPQLFDGEGYGTGEEDNTSPLYTSRARYLRSSSADSTLRLHSPTPVRPSRPNSLHGYGIEEIEFASPFHSLVSRPKMASPISDFMSSPMTSSAWGQVAGESNALGSLKRWLSK